MILGQKLAELLIVYPILGVCWLVGWLRSKLSYGSGALVILAETFEIFCQSDGVPLGCHRPYISDSYATESYNLIVARGHGIPRLNEKIGPSS